MDSPAITITALIIVIFATSLLSAVMTLLLASYVYRRRYQRQLEQQLKQVGEEIQDRVRQGVLDAGDELLPKFQDRVRDGFVEAVQKWDLSDDILNIAKSGADLVGDGLSTLLGRNSPTKKR